MSSRDMAMGHEPELRVKREEGILGLQISDKGTVGIGRCSHLLDEDCVSFENVITLVRG
jgi:hypothetical protein